MSSESRFLSFELKVSSFESPPYVASNAEWAASPLTNFEILAVRQLVAGQPPIRKVAVGVFSNGHFSIQLNLDNAEITDLDHSVDEFDSIARRAPCTITQTKR